jgi:hypothetical protein
LFSVFVLRPGSDIHGTSWLRLSENFLIFIFCQPVCTDCGGTVIEYDQAAGNGFCVQCGTVVEENTIVNEVAFGETSNGAAMVQGSFVGQGASTPSFFSFLG